MKKLNSLLNKVALFEKLAQYGDRKSFLESMAQDTRSTWSPEPFYPNLGGGSETGSAPEPENMANRPVMSPPVMSPPVMSSPSESKSPEVVKANSLLAECYNALKNGVNGEIFESLVKRLREMVVFLRASVQSPSLKYPAEVKSVLPKIESMYAKMSAEFNKDSSPPASLAKQPMTVTVPPVGPWDHLTPSKLNPAQQAQVKRNR